MIIRRQWAMPNKATFTIPPIRELIQEYVGNGEGWIDPFAGDNSPAELTNDLNLESKALFHFDALFFLKSISGLYKGVILDPPYSITQARECYGGFGMELLDIKPTSMEYWKLIKDEMRRLIEPGGLAICCGWNSMGLGSGRGFTPVEILLIPHGGSKNDTIITVEIKLLGQ